MTGLAGLRLFRVPGILSGGFRVVSTAPVESPQLTAAPASEDTAAPVVETPPIETTPDLTAATATATTDEQTETVDPLATFEEDALRNSPRVKALLEAHARDVAAGVEGKHKQELEASARQAEAKANAEAFARQQAELEAVDNGAAVDALYRSLDRAIDPVLDPQAKERLKELLPELGEQAKMLTRSAQTRIDRQYVDATNEYLTSNYPEYRIAPETVAKFDAALVKGDFKGRHAILLDIVKEAAVAAATPAIRTAAVKDLKAEAEKTQQLTEQRAAEKLAQANGGPTNVAGRPAAVGAYRTRAEVAAAHAAGTINNQQARAYYALPLSQLPEF